MKTFIIAEVGINHGGDFKTAKKMIKSAKKCGCSAVKFQTYVTEKRVKPDNPVFDILKRCELTFEQQKNLKNYADEIGIEWFSTPFDTESLDFLVKGLGINRIKISSFDVTNKKFLRQVNDCGVHNTNYKVIMSVGMSNYQSIREAIATMNDVYNVSILHCISAYPTPEQKTNLSAIGALKFIMENKYKVGYSDHTSDILVPAFSVIAGAEIVEKHFTLDRKNNAVDNPVSADPKMMKKMVELIRRYEEVIGDGTIGMKDVERSSEIFKRIS